MPGKVLIIEDEALLLRNLTRCLGRTGVDASGCASVADARTQLGRERYDLVCADIRLGDGDGIDLIASLRETAPDLPVVVMSGQDSVNNRLRAEAVSASAFLAKPFALSRFRELVATLLDDAVVTGHAEDRRPPSVMMYSHDTIGLGHMRRNSAIAGEVVAMMPRASVLMMVGSPAGMVFDMPPGVDFIKLPSLAKVSRNVWRPGSLRISSGETKALRSGLIERAVESFRPDILLVDHEPFGVWEELVPALENLRAAPGAPRVILGLRDILDEPERTRSAWQGSGIADRLRGLYDDILIYGLPEVFPSASAYGLDDLVDGRVRYCGYVTPPRTPRARPRARPATPRIVVSGGGGRDAYPMMASVLEGLSLLPEPVRRNATMIAGPLMDPELRIELKAAALKAGVGFESAVADLPALLDTADLFVTMAGYNALTEALVAGCPTLAIPRVGPSSEQRMRAALFASRGLIECMTREEAQPQALAERFARVRARTPRRRGQFCADGATAAAEHIVEHLALRHPETTAIRPRGVHHA